MSAIRSHQDSGQGEFGPVRNLNVRHETSDVNIRAVLWLGATLMAGALMAYLFLWGLTDYFKARQAGRELNPTPLATERRQIPPEPRLQGAPGHVESGITEWHRFQEQENELLNSYGWIDRQAGVVRLPVERAKELLLQKGLPALPEIPGTVNNRRVLRDSEAGSETGSAGRSAARSAKRTQGVRP
jgi:hypothetical protein